MQKRSWVIAGAVVAGSLLIIPIAAKRHRRPIVSSGKIAVKQAAITKPQVKDAPDYQGRPLFKQTTKILHTNSAWHWAGLFHRDYRWINDTEFLFGKSYHTPDMGKFEYEHLFRYNIKTHRKSPLPRLENRIPMFYHLDVEVSPDGKWVVWRNVDGGASVSQVNGNGYREWDTPSGWGSTLWKPDSQHYVLTRDNDSETTPTIEYDRTSAAAVRSYDLGEASGTAGNYSVISKMNCLVDAMDIGSNDDGPITVGQTPLMPGAHRKVVSIINLPKTLLRPNIVWVLLSPNAGKIAIVVGHGLNGPTCPRDSLKPLEDSHTFRDYTLFVCDAKGGQMHEIGTWKEPVYPNVLLEFEDMRWLPGGHRMSFFYKNTMYTVPAE